MALNITLAGTVYDKSLTPIDAYVQVFVFNSNNNLTKWSDIRSTEDTDYNINLGDPDISGQENTLGLSDASNEYALIAVWTKDSPDRNTPANEFVFVFHELSGEEVYIQNIQLGLPLPITCENWSVPESLIQGETLIAINNNTNELQYDAFGTTHYLYKKYFNETIFNYMGSCTTEFDFGSGYSASNVYVPAVGGDIIVKIKVQDCFGNEAICEKTVEVYYDVEPCFNYSPDSIKTGDTITLESCTSGNIEHIISEEYLHNEISYEGPNASITINEFGEIIISLNVTFWNGYEDVTKTVTKTISMDNIPPEISLEFFDISKEEPETIEYEFAHNGTDVDGFIEKVKWEIWRNNPNSLGNDNWSLYYTTGEITDLSNWEYDFTDIHGQFKIKSTVYDNLGATASQEYLLDEISCADIYNITEEILCYENLDWSKKMKVIEFSIKPIIKTWENKIIKFPWEVNTNVIPWDVRTRRIIFDPLIKRIEFVYKLTDIGRKGFL